MPAAAHTPSPPFRVMLSLYLAMMTIGMGQTVLFAVIPMLGRELALDEIVLRIPLLDWQFRPRETAITSLSAVTALVFALVSPFWGRLSDRYGRKPLIILGLFGYAFGNVIFNGVAWLGLTGLLGGAMLFSLLLLMRILHACLMGATHPSAFAYIIDVTSVRDRAKGVGKLGAFNHIGAMVGPALAWFVTYSFLTPLYLQAAICALAAVLVWWFLPPIPVRVAKHERQKRLRYLDPRYGKFVIIGFIMFSMLGMVQQTLGFYFQDLLGLERARAAQLFSMAMVVSSVAMLVAQFGVVQRFSGHPINLLRFGLPFCLIGYLLLANALNLPMLLMGIGLFGFGMGLAGPGFNVSATLVVEAHEQGALAGLMASGVGLGFVAGPLLGGILYTLNPTYPYWSAAALMFLLTVFVIWRGKNLVK